ncbi:helix-turn-helix transcriptional regulator [Clostridium kluyveri]|uniref:helix-turn-helix transcriptional regulator n=1 Tax=Clostridium kluyveri TaxID=1534 RepID=UPI002246FE59|nr:helix-turn-helix domain-containing protein [Clostridium kluyveri]UZQ49802.1 helix-turn-helix domain-containing protein [Clostridium kluyveri]
MQNNLKTTREILNISGCELAKRVNVKSSMIYMIESGKRNPSLSLARKISKTLNKSIEEIFFVDKSHLTLPEFQKEVV